MHVQIYSTLLYSGTDFFCWKHLSLIQTYNFFFKLNYPTEIMIPGNRHRISDSSNDRGVVVSADLFIVQPTRKYFGSVKKKTKNPKNTHFWTFGPLVWDRVFQINTNLYSVPRTFVLNIQKDRSIRTKVMARKP